MYFRGLFRKRRGRGGGIRRRMRPIAYERFKISLGTWYPYSLPIFMKKKRKMNIRRRGGRSRRKFTKMRRKKYSRSKITMFSKMTRPTRNTYSRRNLLKTRKKYRRNTFLLKETRKYYSYKFSRKARKIIKGYTCRSYTRLFMTKRTRTIPKYTRNRLRARNYKYTRLKKIKKNRSMRVRKTNITYRKTKINRRNRINEMKWTGTGHRTYKPRSLRTKQRRIFSKKVTARIYSRRSIFAILRRGITMRPYTKQRLLRSIKLRRSKGTMSRIKKNYLLFLLERRNNKLKRKNTKLRYIFNTRNLRKVHKTGFTKRLFSKRSYTFTKKQQTESKIKKKYKKHTRRTRFTNRCAYTLKPRTKLKLTTIKKSEVKKIKKKWRSRRKHTKSHRWTLASRKYFMSRKKHTIKTIYTRKKIRNGKKYSIRKISRKSNITYKKIKIKYRFHTYDKSKNSSRTKSNVYFIKRCIYHKMPIMMKTPEKIIKKILYFSRKYLKNNWFHGMKRNKRGQFIKILKISLGKRKRFLSSIKKHYTKRYHSRKRLISNYTKPSLRGRTILSRARPIFHYKKKRIKYTKGHYTCKPHTRRKTKL